MRLCKFLSVHSNVQQHVQADSHEVVLFGLCLQLGILTVCHVYTLLQTERTSGWDDNCPFLQFVLISNSTLSDYTKSRNDMTLSDCMSPVFITLISLLH